MLLTTALYSIIKTHSPEEVNIYALDFESGTLKAFENAPQIGDVILSDDTEIQNTCSQAISCMKNLGAEIIDLRLLHQVEFFGNAMHAMDQVAECTLPHQKATGETRAVAGWKYCDLYVP